MNSREKREHGFFVLRAGRSIEVNVCCAGYKPELLRWESAVVHGACFIRRRVSICGSADHKHGAVERCNVIDRPQLVGRHAQSPFHLHEKERLSQYAERSEVFSQAIRGRALDRWIDLLQDHSIGISHNQP